MSEHFDYVIVGGGTAGLVLANRLSQSGRHRVAVLEAGGKDTYPWIHIPIGYLYCIGNPRTDWCYETEPEAGLNGRAIGYPRGKVLGGCSSINGMLYQRGQPEDYDLWRQLGNTGWGWDDVRPLFLKSEDHFAGASTNHGAGGEWRVERQRLRWEILDSFAKACAGLGIPEVEDLNAGSQEGVSYFQVNQRRGWRWNTARGFLAPARGRANLAVITGAEVEEILFDGSRACGLAYRRNGQRHKIHAQAEVILSAGAINTPKILMLSGIGPGAHLADMGIGVRIERDAVGSDLQDHLQLRCAYRVRGVATLNARASTLWGKAGIGLEYLLRRSGPMAMAPSQLGAFARSDPDQATPDLEYHVQPLSLPRFGAPLDPFGAFTASVCHLRPQSRGTVRLRARDPATAPRIAPNYLSCEADRQVAARAIALTRRIVAQPALARYQPEEIRPGPAFSDAASLAQAAAEIGTTIFHPVGTARMGSDAQAVVDPELRLRGCEGLRVVDASIMPRITSANTASPTVMIAEKAAGMILEAARG